MNGRGPEIWVADLARALDAVGDDPETRRRAARMLGFADRPAVSDTRSEVPAGPPAMVTPPEDPPFEPLQEPSLAPPGRFSGAAQPLIEQPSSRYDDLPVLEPVAHEAPSPTDWGKVPSLEEVPKRHATVRPPLEPLLTKRSSAAILNAALTTVVRDDGEPDIDALVDSFARGIPLTRLPRAPRPTLRFGVQVLVDVGGGMQPFRRDQQELTRQITGLVGAELTQVGYFADLPSRGAGPGARSTWQPYRPPGPGTRVLIVSDLGVGGPLFHSRRASATEWYQVLDEIVRAGCTALALVPYPADRVPAQLTRLLSALTWDRTTTVSTVAAVVGRRP